MHTLFSDNKAKKKSDTEQGSKMYTVASHVLGSLQCSHIYLDLIKIKNCIIKLNFIKLKK